MLVRLGACRRYTYKHVHVDRDRVGVLVVPPAWAHLS